MTTRSLITALALVLLLTLAGWALFVYIPNIHAPAPPAQERTPVATASYACDHNKTISATFYAGPKAPTPAPGEPPTPTGSVDVSLNGGATTTLGQTISADGARYANADESFVFWSKGNSALVMHNNAMDLDYTNCTVVH